MEYVDIIKGLSSVDPLSRISTIARIIYVIKKKKNPVLVNSMAVSMAVEFSKSSNRDRFFIEIFFKECASELSVVKNKLDLFRVLSSVLDLNDPIAQCLTIKIMGYLSPLLPDLIEIHHKILLLMQSQYRRVRKTVESVLPDIVRHVPSITKHLLEIPLSPSTLVTIIPMLPEEKVLVKKAYGCLWEKAENEVLVKGVVLLACKCKELLEEAKRLIVEKRCENFAEILIRKYGEEIFEADTASGIRSENRIVELLEQQELKENDYKFIYENWKSFENEKLVLNRLGITQEWNFIFKLLTLLKIDVREKIPKYILDESNYQICEYLTSVQEVKLEIVHRLNDFDQYRLCIFLLQNARFTEAHPLLVRLKTDFRGNEERFYEWICFLTEIAIIEKSPRFLSASESTCIVHIGCIGQNTFFHQKLLQARILLLNALRTVLEGEVYPEDFYYIRSLFSEILKILKNPRKKLVYFLEEWREICSMLAVSLRSDLGKHVKRYFPKSSRIFEESAFSSPTIFASKILDLPFKYPIDFFIFRYNEEMKKMRQKFPKKKGCESEVKELVFSEELVRGSTIDLIRGFNSRKHLENERKSLESTSKSSLETKTSEKSKILPSSEKTLRKKPDLFTVSKSVSSNENFPSIITESFKILEQIGHGSYSIVWKAIHLISNTLVALKSYDRVKLIKAHLHEKVFLEVAIINSLNHPGVVKMFELIETPKKIYIAMQYIEGFQLRSFLKTQKPDEKQIKFLFRQIVEAIQYCHTQNVIHRDIKLDNILVTHENRVKIIDFGFSTMDLPWQKARVFCGTPRYMAPEILAKKEFAGAPADVWALGVVLYAMVCGYFPFKGKTTRELFENIESGEFFFPRRVSAEARAVVKRMMEKKVEKRISLEELLEDSWMAVESEEKSVEESEEVRIEEDE